VVQHQHLKETKKQHPYNEPPGYETPLHPKERIALLKSSEHRTKRRVYARFVLFITFIYVSKPQDNVAGW
jgi:hypothetical protein